MQKNINWQLLDHFQIKKWTINTLILGITITITVFQSLKVPVMFEQGQKVHIISIHDTISNCDRSKWKESYQRIHVGRRSW